MTMDAKNSNAAQILPPVKNVPPSVLCDRCGYIIPPRVQCVRFSGAVYCSVFCVFPKHKKKDADPPKKGSKHVDLFRSKQTQSKDQEVKNKTSKPEEKKVERVAAPPVIIKDDKKKEQEKKTKRKDETERKSRPKEEKKKRDKHKESKASRKRSASDSNDGDDKNISDYRSSDKRKRVLGNI